jgi:putative ABC transport system permease protein
MSVLRTKIRRDLRRSRAQFIAIAITIFLGITLFGGAYDSYRSLEASYGELYDRLSFADLWVSGGDVDAFAEEARSTDGVAAAETRYQADAGLRPVADRALFGRLIGLPTDGQPAVNAVMVLEGAYLQGPGDVLVDHHIADHYDLAIGGTIDVADTAGDWRPFRISGIVASAEYVWPAPSRQQIFSTPDDFGVVFLANEMVAELAGPGAIPQAVVRYADDADANGLDTALTAIAIADLATDTYTEEQQASNSALQEDVKGFGDLAFMFPALFLTAAGLGTWVMLTRLVMTQLPVIGTLMANGMRRRSVFGHYLLYGVVVGLSGAIPGVIAGALMAWGVSGFYTSAIDVPITVVRIDATTPVTGILFGLVAGLVAAAFPAWRAIRLTPAEALRGAQPTGIARPTLPERVIPALRRLPTTRALVMRNIFRNKRRTLTTMFGVVLSLMLILVSWGMIDTVQVLLDRQFGEVERSDARAVLISPDPAVLTDLGSVPGVAAVEPVLSTQVAVEANGERYGTSLEAMVPGTTMHGFYDDGVEISLPAEGVILGSSLEKILGIDVGDSVRIAIPALDVTLDETVAGFVTEPLGTVAYASLTHIGDALTSTSPVDRAGVSLQALLRLDDGVDFEDVRSDIESVDGVLAVQSTRSLEETMQSFMALFYAFIGIMLAFGGMLAFGIIFNTMSVNLAERRVEVATMEAAGIGERRLARLITAENVLVTLIAIIPGLVLGYLTAAQFMSAYNTDQFTFDLEMRSSTLVLSALFIVVVTLLSQWPGLRAVRRLDIAQVVRERAV